MTNGANSDEAFIGPIYGGEAAMRAPISGPLAPRSRAHNLRRRIASIPHLRLAFGTAGCAAYLAIAGVCAWGVWALEDMPDTSDLWAQKRPASVIFLDRHGRKIGVRGGRGSKPISLELIPDALPQAILATEDRRFYYHPGFDPIGMGRALWKNHKAGRVVEGGSTLTQQLAKNVFLTPDKTLRRKSQEILLALWLEQRFTKQEILELYLGRVYFGAGAYGVDAAAERYFAKPASDLTVGECAMLAGLLKAPSRYSPASNAELASGRTTAVLQKMVAANYITPTQRDAIFATPIYVEPPEPQNSYGYFIDWAWGKMEAELGAPQEDMTVQTTLDGPAQIRGELAITARLNPKRGASQAALVSMDGTGAVRAMIGGANYQDSKFNRASLAKRQPGSAFKPFVYLAALRAGSQPHDTRIDAPVQIGDWEPGNFSGEYIGEVTLATAFTKSLNTVAVLLSEESGRETIVQTAGQFGLTGMRPLRSIALGAQEVTPLALTESYLPFANYGYSAKAYAIETIYTADGRALYQREPTGSKRIISGKVLRDMNLMMHMTVEGGTGKNARIEGYDLAGKTGTTNDYRDAWFIGYAPDYVTGIWVGADDNSPMSRVTGGSIPARIWHDYMEGALAGLPKTRLPKSVMPEVLEIASAPPVIIVTAPAPKPVADDSALGKLLSNIESKLP